MTFNIKVDWVLETIKQFAIARVNKAADLGLEAFVEHLTGS